MKALIIFAAILAAFCAPGKALAQDVAGEAQRSGEQALQSGVERAIDEIDLSGLEELYDQAGRPLAADSFEEAVRSLASQGLTELGVQEVLSSLLELIKSSLAGSGATVFQILTIILLLALVRQLGGSEMTRAAFWVCYAMVAALAAGILGGCAGVVRSALSSLGGAVNVLTPTLMALLTAIGGLGTSALMSPLLAALTGGMFDMIKSAIIPASLASAVLSLVSGMSGSIKLTKLSELIGTLVKWALGIMFIVFVGLCAMKGFMSGSLDGISMKTAKFAVDKLVPVIGGMFSDTLDTILGSGLIVKNAVGTGGLVVLICLMAAPLASLGMSSLLLGVGAALSQPFADSRTTELLSCVASCVRLMFSALLTCVSMAFISVALLMGATSMAAMLR